MKIIDAKVNMFFNPINGDEDYISSIVDSLKANYNLANVISTCSPAEIPDEIPRIVGNSKNGHTQLTISLNRAVIETVFDGHYMDDVNKCIKYIKDKSEELYLSLNKLVDSSYLFSGVTITVILDNLGLEPIEIIRENFANLKTNSELYDVSSKFTYIVNEKHFANINISNARGVEEVQGGFSKKVNHLAVTLDVNDRYAFNEKPNYKSKYESLVSSIEITKRICNEELKKLITGEELDI